MSDFTTASLRVKATERYTFSVTDYRAAFGTTHRMLWPTKWLRMYKHERGLVLKEHGLFDVMDI